jgi:hypothetical protein
MQVCLAAVHAMGCPRLFTALTVNTPTDRAQSLDDRPASVQAVLG